MAKAKKSKELKEVQPDPFKEGALKLLNTYLPEEQDIAIVSYLDKVENKETKEVSEVLKSRFVYAKDRIKFTDEQIHIDHINDAVKHPHKFFNLKSVKGVAYELGEEIDLSKVKKLIFLKGFNI